MQRFLTFFVLLFFLSCPISAKELGPKIKDKTSNITINEHSQFGLAQHFFDEGNYFRAITEYKRFIYYFSQSSLSEMAYFKIGEAYFRGKRWKQAIQAFEQLREKFPKGDLVDRSYYLTGMAYFHKKDCQSSRKQFRKIIDLFPKSELIDDARLQIAMSYVEEKKWQNALNSLRKIEKGSNLYQSAKSFAFGLKEIDKLPFRSPALAGTFAAVLPGSGHFYTGRKKDGATAFLLNGAFIWGAVESFDDEDYAVAGILTFFELGWYFGNIYGAVSSAHKYNKRLKDRYIKNLKERNGLSLRFDQVHKSYYLALHYRF